MCEKNLLLEEYKKELSSCYKQYKFKIKKLQLEYAKSGLYKIGDIIEDHYHIIKIEKPPIYSFSSFPKFLPSAVYFGTELTKKLVRKKSQCNHIMYESNVTRKLN